MDKYLHMGVPNAAANVPLIQMSGPVLVFGGCYGNFEATQALREQAWRLGIPPERSVCTGDVVAYCADPAATVALIREWGVHVIMGNCEEAVGMDAEHCGCGYAKGSACDALSIAWYAYARSHVDESAREWMRRLPARIDISIAGRRLAVVHGAVDSISGFIFLSTPWPEKYRQIEQSGCDGVVGGHCGIPFTQIAGNKLWHNSGSAGLPANDGTPRVWYSAIVPIGNAIAMQTRPLHYDAALAARKMRRAGLPACYADALLTGLWPTRDVLPAAELARAGMAIPPGGVLWDGTPQKSGLIEPFASIACKFQHD